MKVSERPTLQNLFEQCLIEMGIKKGCLSISQDGSKYLNEHIQWLWEQFVK